MIAGELENGCIKCGEEMRDRGWFLRTEHRLTDGVYVFNCHNPECSNFGLLTTITGDIKTKD